MRLRSRIALIGELSLGGEVRAVPGILPMATALARRGLRRVIVPETMKEEAALADGIEAIGVATLRDAVEVVRRRAGRRTVTLPPRVDLGVDSTPSALVGATDRRLCHGPLDPVDTRSIGRRAGGG